MSFKYFCFVLYHSQKQIFSEIENAKSFISLLALVFALNKSGSFNKETKFFVTEPKTTEFPPEANYSFSFLLSFIISVKAVKIVNQAVS